MSSNKTNGKSRAAVAPQRSHGRARVAALLESAAAEIAGKGYDGATMAGIAARAGAPIGSLYRFFPNKELIANALVQRYIAAVNESFDALDSRVRALSTDAVADALLDFMMDLRAGAKTMLGFLNASAEWSAHRTEFRNLALKRLARTLAILSPSLTRAAARDAAVILLHNMKTMAALKFDKNAASSPGAANELRNMNRLYLAGKLDKKHPVKN